MATDTQIRTIPQLSQLCYADWSRWRETEALSHYIKDYKYLTPIERVLRTSWEKVGTILVAQYPHVFPWSPEKEEDFKISYYNNRHGQANAFLDHCRQTLSFDMFMWGLYQAGHRDTVRELCPHLFV